MRKRISAILLAICLSLTLFPATAYAADETGGGPVVSKNAGTNNYPPANWAATVKSYLYENDNDGLTRVEYVNNKVVVEDYSSLFTYISGRTIEPELGRWGGFFAGESYNFLIFGQNNPDEDNQREVIRVVKYDRNWNRLGDARLLGSNTWRPFDGGSLRCAENNGDLYIRTCHEMYKAKDGYHHQASMMLVIDEETMDIKAKSVGISDSSYAYVSHSFNQFILIDREGRMVVADHGDTYPRAIALYRRLKANDSTPIQTLAAGKYLGDNVTGASFGGLAETLNGYVSAYNYAGSASNSAPRRIYLGYTTKDGLQTTPNILTAEGVAGKTPVLASTGLDGGYILWNSTDNNSNTLYYAAYSDGGTVDGVQTAEGVLSDCQPVSYNGQVVWYTTNNSGPVFYTLDEDGVEALPWDRVICETHQPDRSELVSAGNGRHGYRCTVCFRVVETVSCEYGEETLTKAPTCTEPGQYTAVCTVCGYEKVTEGEPALGGEHEFYLDEEGRLVCKQCGEVIPEDTKPQVYEAYEAVQKISPNEIRVASGQTDEEIRSAVEVQIKKLLQGIAYDSVTVELTGRGACSVVVVAGGVPLTRYIPLQMETDDETYYISIPNASNGEIIPNTRYAAQGERVTLTAHPDNGYELTDISVTDLRGRAVTLRKTGDGSYSFTMPDTRVTVDAEFAKAQADAPSDTNPDADEPSTGDEPFTGLGTPGISGIVLNPAAMSFTDVRANDWFYNSVDYVWKHYLMSGVSDTQFAPDDTTTRAMIWTVLARMNNIRTEVNPGPNWYERGMTWAKEQGITDGSDPMGNITREQLAAMLWRSAGSPGVTADVSGFSDSGSVSDYAKSAVSWAVASGILNGSDGKLNPQGTATRAQVAAMVMRYGERIGA